jgi:hypothetical protein
MTKFKLGNEKNTNNLSPGANKNKIQKEKDKKKKIILKKQLNISLNAKI